MPGSVFLINDSLPKPELSDRQSKERCAYLRENYRSLRLAQDTEVGYELPAIAMRISERDLNLT